MAHYFLRHREQPLVVIFSPKCACTSLRQWFVGAHGFEDERSFNIDSVRVDPGEIADLEGHEVVLFLRDPLRRLVSFYCHGVVRLPHFGKGWPRGTWAFADDDGRFRLHGKTFREFLFVLVHLRRHGVTLQHHLEPQMSGVEGFEVTTTVATEHMADAISRLNARYGFGRARLPVLNATKYGAAGVEMAGDRPPAWLRRHGIPEPELFFDEEGAELAAEVYGEDIARYRALPGVEALSERVSAG